MDKTKIAKELVKLARQLVGEKVYHNEKELVKGLEKRLGYSVEELGEHMVKKSQYPVSEGDSVWRSVLEDIKETKQLHDDDRFGDSGF
jgi:iron-sulfur cluster repair protein YtfE (RIC family)